MEWLASCESNGISFEEYLIESDRYNACIPPVGDPPRILSLWIGKEKARDVYAEVYLNK